MTTTVAVFGSCNMDLVAYVGTAPKRGETVLGREFRTAPGGKGANQAVAAARAGAEALMIGAVGEDELGGGLREALRGFGVDTRGLRTVPGNSGTAHIVVDDDGGNAIVVVPGANATVDSLAPGDAELIASSGALLLQLEIPFAGVESAAAAGRSAGVPVILTPAPAAELSAELLANVDVLVPNEHEAAVLTGRDDPDAALRELVERVPEAIITLGAEGALYGNAAGEVVRSPAHRVRAVDTTAAGDTFVGVFAAARAGGAEVREALAAASAASALAVGRHGAMSSMPTEQEIREFRG
ncbi:MULTISPECIES: ribokinase [Saccharopolyspora]|uniref:ribokinase n=1 Tax=Saccharopolyspora TaxID=1835 RepID=UPI001CD20EDA|nr:MULTISPECIES: ribokinase [Saccharopolyspora]MCA1195368.1 ribokinase [Saccharopolyspora sp. 6V]